MDEFILSGELEESSKKTVIKKMIILLEIISTKTYQVIEKHVIYLVLLKKIKVIGLWNKLLIVVSRDPDQDLTNEEIESEIKITIKLLAIGIIGGKIQGQEIGIRIIIIDKENAKTPISIIGTGNGAHLEIKTLLIGNKVHLTAFRP